MLAKRQSKNEIKRIYRVLAPGTTLLKDSSCTFKIDKQGKMLVKMGKMEMVKRGSNAEIDKHIIEFLCRPPIEKPVPEKLEKTESQNLLRICD